jgi:ribosomal protein RSM22 (predicted rRNA methylase)
MRRIEDALWSAARLELGERLLKQKSLVPAIERISERYTRERDRIDEIGGDDELAARAVFFTVADAAKIAVPIAELRAAGALPERSPLRVLDVGAGCGAMSLGLIDALGDALGDAVGDLAITAVDRDADALAIFELAFDHLDTKATLETEVVDLRGWRGSGLYELIAVGSALNELDEADAHALVAALIERLARGGALIAVEPALRETSRRLHEIRDRVIGEGRGFVFAPCTRTAARCPALDDERDWCHEDRHWDPPRRLGQLTRATGLRQQRLKFAYLVIRREPGTVAGDREALRVVSKLKKMKGASELWVCDDDGRRKLRLQKRDRGDANRAFERARRGELLEIGSEELETVARKDPTDPPPDG